MSKEAKFYELDLKPRCNEFNMVIDFDIICTQYPNLYIDSILSLKEAIYRDHHHKLYHLIYNDWHHLDKESIIDLKYNTKYKYFSLLEFDKIYSFGEENIMCDSLLLNSNFTDVLQLVHQANRMSKLKTFW